MEVIFEHTVYMEKHEDTKCSDFKRRNASCENKMQNLILIFEEFQTWIIPDIHNR